MPATTIPLTLKTTVTDRLTAFLTDVLAPRHLIPRPPDYQWAHPIALYCRWWRSTYRRPYLDGTFEDVEDRFVRLEYRGRNRFALSYFRHTGRWQLVYPDLSLAACIHAITTQEFFWP